MIRALDITATPAPARYSRHLYRYTFERRAIGEAPAEAMDTPERAARILAPLFAGAERESLYVVMLNRKQRIVGIEETYRGNAAGMAVRICEVFTAAVRLGATGILVAHNHPSGDPEPSGDDIRSTRDIAAAGRVLGIPLVDHIVIGTPDRWVSLKERGAL